MNQNQIMEFKTFQQHFESGVSRMVNTKVMWNDKEKKWVIQK